MKRFLVGIVILIILATGSYFLFVHKYKTSPGHVTAEMYAEFERTKKECVGWSTLITSPKDIAADAPGEALCIGWLK